MNKKQLKGLLNLTRVVLEQIFSKHVVSSNTNEDIEVFSSVVFHNLCSLCSGEHFDKHLILIDRYGIGTGKPKTLEHLANEYSTTTEYMRQVEQEALHQLTEAVLEDLLAITAYHLEKEDKAQVCAISNQHRRYHMTSYL